MKATEKKTKTGLVIIIMMLVLPCAAIAGNLEPSAAPAPTMHTLDDIYNKTSAQTLPDPDTVNFVTKSLSGSSGADWQTIHTVAQGKTFYLMGATGTGSLLEISFIGGFFYLPGGQALSAAYPIASLSSGSEVMVRDRSSGYYCTIFGYEK